MAVPIAGVMAAIDLVLSLVDRVAQVSTTIKKAQNEGRDITTQELDALAATDDAASARLATAIAKAKADGW